MTSKVTNISGVGSVTAIILAGHKFKTVTSIAGATVEKLSAVPGFSAIRASKTIDAAKELLAATAPSSDTGISTSMSEAPSKAKGKKSQKAKNKKTKGKKRKDKAKEKKKSDKKKSKNRKKKNKNKKNRKK